MYIYISKDGRLMEKFIFNKDIIDKNISQVILKGQTSVEKDHLHTSEAN